MPKTFKDAKTVRDDGKKWEDDIPVAMVDIRELAKSEYRPIRLVKYIEPFMRFWIPTEASKAYDPYKTGVKQYPSICVDFDPVEEVFSGNECQYRKAHYQYVDDKSGEKKWGKLKPTKNYLIFFIDREMQEERSGTPLARKIKNPEKYGDIKCATVPTAFIREVQNAIELYKKKTKLDADPTDEKEGFDLFFKFDPTADAASKYTAMLGDASPLTKEELRQLKVLPETVNIYPKDSPAKIRESLARHGYVVVQPGQDPEEALAEGADTSKKSKSTMKAGGVETLEDDDEEEETPRRRKKPPVEQFEDEDDDLDLDDEELDEDDLDEDDADLEDDEDEDDDDDDEDLDEDDADLDDEDEEEEKPAKKKAARKKAPAKKKAARKKAPAKKKAARKPEPEDDEEFGFDDDFDE